MKRQFFVLISSIILLSIACKKTNKVQEYNNIEYRLSTSKPKIDISSIIGTWYELTIENGDTIVYRIPNLENEKLVVPNYFKLTSDSLLRMYFNEEQYGYPIDTLWVNNNEYFFPIGNKFSFKWIDKERKIGMWIDYYGREHWNDTLSAYLYVKKEYNTFPVKDFSWEESEEIPMDD